MYNLFSHFYKFLIRNGSFLILLLSSMSFFLANYVLKVHLDGEEYGDFSLILVLLNISSSFCFLGTDQLLMRVCRIDDGSITIEKKVIFLMIICFVTYSLATSYLFKKFYFPQANLYEFILMNLMMGFLTFQYSIFRILKFFEDAQIQKNGWKILFFLGSLIVLYIKINIVFLIGVLLVVFTISIIYGIRKLRKIKIVLISGKIPLALWLNFASSMLIMNLLNSFDKFLIEYKLSRTELGDYFFLQNIFLLPFSQLQTYAGFKLLAIYKQGFNKHKLLKENLKYLVYGILLTACVSVTFFIYNEFFQPIISITQQHMIFILLFIITGIIRILYANVSAAMGAMGTNRMIFNSNLSFLTISLVIGCPIYILFNSLNSVVLLIGLLWIIRYFTASLNLNRYESQI